MIKTFEEAKNYIYSFIPHAKDVEYDGERFLLRTKAFMELLGNPQEKINVIHIAGTSGKGSTAYLTSLALFSQGFKTGLQISPHITDMSERIQINNKKIDKDKFATYLNEVVPAIEQMKETKYGFITFFELLTGLAFYVFEKENVDYAVMETGMGGKYDGTNVVENENKVVIINKIGFDHQRFLGNTLAEISSNKAGIIVNKNKIFALNQNKEALEPIKSQSEKVRGDLEIVEPKDLMTNVTILNNKGTLFDYNGKSLELKNSELGLLGRFQLSNLSLALKTLEYLSTRDGFEINSAKLKFSLKNAFFLGRFHKIEINGCNLILDGAHNPDKMEAFIGSLTELYPNEKFDFLLSFKIGKDYEEMLKLILPLARNVMLTSFHSDKNDSPQLSTDSNLVEKILKSENFTNYEIIDDLKTALDKFLRTDNHAKVITGSLYLLSEVYPLLGKA